MANAQSAVLVGTAGLGRAGGSPDSLHGHVWDNTLRDEFLAEGIEFVHFGYDISEARRDAARRDMAHMTVIDELEELPHLLDGRPLGVLDITTASGHHAKPLGQFLGILAGTGLAPKSIIVEKPVVNSDTELAEMNAILAEYDIEQTTFGIEHYLNSPALRKAIELVHQKGVNSITKLRVNFSKNRVPDVRDGRFQDEPSDPHLLSSLGIEPPHMYPLVEELLGIKLDTRPASEGGNIQECRLYHDIDGIPESEGTYITAKHGGTSIVLEQALGPFTFDDNGNLVRYDWGKAVSRTVSIALEDKSGLEIIFDPVPERDRFQCMLISRKPNGEETVILDVPDEALPDTLRAVTRFALSGVRSEALVGMDVRSAMRRYSDLMALRQIGGKQVRVPSLDKRSVARRQAGSHSHQYKL